MDNQSNRSWWFVLLILVPCALCLAYALHVRLNRAETPHAVPDRSDVARPTTRRMLRFVAGGDHATH